MKLLRWRQRRDEELNAEIQQHLDAAIRERIERGETLEQARINAQREFGNVGLVKEVTREMWGWGSLERLGQDLRFGLRMLRKNPGFTLIAVFTLALGIGANTAIFSVVNALMLRPLPYPNPEQLVWVEEVTPTSNNQPAWGAHFLAWQAQSRTLAGIAQVDGATQTLTGVGEPERVAVGKVSASFLPLLGAQPLPGGRTFSVAEDAPGGERVALLSYGLWQRRYNSESGIVGRSITLNDTNYTVLGVLPASFRFPSQFDVWTPLALDPVAELVGPNRSFQTTIARLNPGVSLEQARVEMDTLRQHYETTRPEGTPRIKGQARLVPLQEHLLGGTRRALLVLLGAVTLILLIACANVANLLLARAVTRQKELAIRAALGASRWRLVRQLLTECLLLALAGGLAGLLLAVWLANLLGALISTDTIGGLAQVTAIKIDLRVLSFTLLVSLLTGLLFGLFPAWQLSPPNLNVSLKEGGRSSGVHSRKLRGALLVSEVALAIVLLIGAGLLIRSFVKLLWVDPGFRAENVLTARLLLPPRYGEKAQRAQFYEQLLPHLTALPGVVAAGATSHLPLTNYNMGGGLRVEGRPLQEGEQLPAAPIAAISPDYFRTMGISLLAGRVFNDGDRQDAPSVALLSEKLARRLFPNEDPLGKRLAVAGSGAEWTTVVGVVSDIHHRGPERESEPSVYLPYQQLPRGMSLVLRSTVEPSSLASALRNAVRELDPSVPVYEVMTMNERLSRSVAARRFNLVLLGGFAALALLLAGVGVYGVISYLVTGRTHEVGIRLALGARSADVMRLFIKQGMTLVLLGVALGALGAVALTRLMTSLLFGVGATDPLTFIAVVLLLTMVALLACWLPARRATKVDPLVALRHE